MGCGRFVRRRVLALLMASACALASSGCKQISESMSVQPRSLRDVPAQRLAFRLEPDVETNNLPANYNSDEAEELLAPVKTDFETRRTEEALLRTLLSPDGQVALALYATSETPEGDYRMDLYSSAGQFLRNVLPPELSGTFPQTVAWSPDGQGIAFIGIRNAAAPQPTPTPFEPLLPPDAGSAGVPPTTTDAPTPLASATPFIAPVPVFNTEQIYTCDRHGYNIKPLTARDGLIYFQLAWSPDSSAIAALACKPDEWDARRREDKAAAGRPRLINMQGGERLLADRLADAAPVWSPDASKVATAFDTDIGIFDALGDTPSAANIPLREPLLTASAQYDAQKLPKTNTAATSGGNSNVAVVTEATPATTETPLSFNPIVRLEWPQPETLFVRTAFLRLYKSGEVIRNYPRWHVLRLSAQAAVLSGNTDAPDAAGSSLVANGDAASSVAHAWFGRTCFVGLCSHLLASHVSKNLFNRSDI